jgi:DNA-binding Lrp family transcriptional regulator
MSTAFVFHPDVSFERVRTIREARVMPAPGLRYVAAVTGPWKIFEIVEAEALDDLAKRLDSLAGGDAGGSGDPPNAFVVGTERVRRSVYRTHTALVRIDVGVDDPRVLLPAITDVIGSDEADVVMGDFDILACVVDDDESGLTEKIHGIRGIDGVKRTRSLRVLDYVSTSGNATGVHKVAPAP